MIEESKVADQLSKLEAERLEDRYELLDVIGSGSFAQVSKARQKFGLGELRAIKRIQINPLADQITEISHLKTLKCDHIIQFYGYILEEQSNELNIIMQLCKGSLRDQINKEKYFGPSHMLDLITQVTNAMLHLNDKFIMHLDLKPENILYEEDNFYKLCDFGCAQLFQNISVLASNQKDLRNRVLSSVGMCCVENAFGTPRYIAPEIQLNFQRMGKNSCDMWSLGIILYELIYKKHPFDLDKNGRVKDKDFKKFCQNMLKISFPPTKQKYPIELVKLMLQPQPIKRITWRKLKQILIKEYKRQQAQFLNTEQIAKNQLKTSLILAEFTMIIEQSIQESPNKIWKAHQDLFLQLKRVLIYLGYSHLLKFYSLFEYKMKFKMSSSAIASFDFMLENLEDEVFSEENPEDHQLDLRDFHMLQEKLSLVLAKIQEKIKEDLSTEMGKLLIFIKQVKDLEGGTLFCNGHRFPLTCEKLDIHEQL